jgi:hypothetical protein
LIADIQGPLKTKNLGNGLIHDPDHIDGAANTDNGGGGFNVKSLLFEFHQVFCKNLEFTDRHAKFGLSFLFLGIELKFVQAQVRFLTHGHVATVFEH